MARAVAACPRLPTSGANEYARPRVIASGDAGPYTGPRELARFLVGTGPGSGRALGVRSELPAPSPAVATCNTSA